MYVVSVRTRLIDFTVEKRYSSFRQLWKRMRQRAPLTCEFPPKTLLSSSAVEPDTVQLRRNLLDSTELSDLEFLKELARQPRELLP